jgi:hypothetical protein
MTPTMPEEVLRGILAPVGHGLWTAILGGTLFAVAAGRGRLRLSRDVLVLRGRWRRATASDRPAPSISVPLVTAGGEQR